MNLPKTDNKKILILLGCFLLAEALSYIGFAIPAANPVVFALFVLAALAATIYKLEYGLLISLAELMITSFGYLIDLDIGGHRFSFRIALWLIVMAVFAVRFAWQLLKQKSHSAYWRNLKKFPAWTWFGLLFFFILVGVASGIFNHHSLSLIFSDANAWFYFLTLVPVVAIWGGLDAAARRNFLNIIIASVLWISIKTLFLLFVFTHNLGLASTAYDWLRRTLVGEMTDTLAGVPRIFLQAQIYSVLAFIIIFWRNAADWEWKKFVQRRSYLTLGFAALCLSAVIISFSRSFWVGLAVALAASLIALWCLRSFNKMLAAAAWAALSLIGAFLIVYIVTVLPVWHPSHGDLSSELLERATDTSESAITSRWSLLPVLTAASLKEPLLGQGYGATVTYKSDDPRVLANNPSGAYTTYAFEWGYFDMWLKIGLLGLLAYFLLLGQMFSAAWRRGRARNNYLYFGLAAGLICLAVVDFFTPYLNHPLGIGVLLAASCLIWLNEVY